MTTIQLVDQRVAAKALNVSLSWLEQDRRSAKTVPWIKLPGARSPKYDLERVRAVLAQHEQGGVAPMKA